MRQTATLPESRRLADGFKRSRVVGIKNRWQVNLLTVVNLLILTDAVEQR